MCLLTQRNVFSQFAFDLLTVIPTNSLLFTSIFPGNYLRFRFPNLTWNSDLICDSRDIPSGSAEFRELTHDFFFQQTNLHPTRFNNILDLVFKNSPESVSNMSCMSPETMGIYTDRCLLFFDFSKHVNSSGFYKSHFQLSLSRLGWPYRGSHPRGPLTARHIRRRCRGRLATLERPVARSRR